ncbi:HTH-type transcriptional regulator CymR [Rubripirellula lacrimiformis]|uniref:HTH-type transcriptional regulator CymR n=1 Tax=Rubripirellula lacrimiformis TaxID=1930273 RepID=A0A517NHC0_9BACT|nr:Rrf2 family transcriptional regulator [Rubripirellula lacrimiformis]QDT06443.1 HTH-type transcriptional regulator CymR [Rubripirellula lacrimiformis]
MAISARVHYASLALVELAVRSDEAGPVTVREISDRHGVPGPFLVQILRTLRSCGWVQSIRGSQGGYRLSVDPGSITLLDIAEAVGCQDSGCSVEGKSTPAEDRLQEVWGQAAEASRGVLSSITLASIVEQIHPSDAAMFYI